MIRYAGFDPFEDDFTDVPMAPLHLHDIGGLRKRTRACGIDPREAFYLKQAGNSWQRVGEMLAQQQGRAIRFTAASCANAVRQWQRERAALQ